MPDTPLLDVLAVHAAFKWCGPACRPRDVPETEWKHVLDAGCVNAVASETTATAFVPQQREPVSDGTFGAHVKTTRLRLGLTLQQAAADIGINFTTLHNAERGSRPRSGNRRLIIEWLERVDSEHVQAAPRLIATVGDLLRAVLVAQGLTQVELAAAMGISTKHLSQLVTGVVHLSPEMAIGLEGATGLPAAAWNATEAAYRDAKIRRVREAADV